MRRYDLIITNSDPKSDKFGKVFKPNSMGGFDQVDGGSTFTSQVQGPHGWGLINNPGALNIEFDIPIYRYHTPMGGSGIHIWGVGLAMIGQAANLNGQYFKLYAGMAKGLPLATAQSMQYGLIAQGQIFQAFGNWLGVNQTLDLICLPGGLEPADGVAFTWAPGMSLKTAIAISLMQAFPSYTSDISISPNLQPPNGATQSGCYPNLTVFAQYLHGLTLPLGAQFAGGDYPGVSIIIEGNVINVYDGTVTTEPKPIAFQDLIGQPTWIRPTEISIKTVLRSDIGVGDKIQLPKGLATPYVLTSPDAAFPNAPSRDKSVFQGTFVVLDVHHFANFRQPDADSWVTVFTATPSLVPASTIS